jgi:hypothetical protein
VKKNIPPYKDKSLTNRKNESWESIPSLDGYFDISSFGRIKRLEREVIRGGIRGGTHILPEKIIAPRVMKTQNKLIKDYTYQLSAHLTLNNICYHFVIRRLVYNCFVKPFDMDEPGKFIISKNGNGLDIRPDNLILLQSSERMKHIYNAKRAISTFNEETYRKANKASLKVICKQVTKYDLNGNSIKTYKSIMDASRDTAISYSLISAVLNKRQNKTREYYFAYGKKKKFDYKSMLVQKQLQLKENRGTKVIQYSLSGKKIATYLTLKDAGAALKKSYTGISANIRGITRVAYGFRWKKL